MEVQGYLFSCPVTADAIPALIKTLTSPETNNLTAPIGANRRRPPVFVRKPVGMR